MSYYNSRYKFIALIKLSPFVAKINVTTGDYKKPLLLPTTRYIERMQQEVSVVACNNCCAFALLMECEKLLIFGSINNPCQIA